VAKLPEVLVTVWKLRLSEVTVLVELTVREKVLVIPSELLPVMARAMGEEWRDEEA
jgi:hypothetical protein